jgi:uncharacterized protein (DUF2141 family)
LDGPKKGKLVINFKGLKSDDGNVIVALCNNLENYDNHKSPFIGKSILIDNNRARIEFDEIPFGEYAIKAFHDEDANNDLNTNIFGIPIEDYGFSNNVRGLFGPPSWEDAKFKFDKENQSMEIVIK